MNSPQQANAAQLAARSIKAKPKGRLANQKPGGFAPVQSNNPNNNAAVGGGGGGGLFGGSVSAPGSFNFAAPAGTPTFTPSFGSSTPNPFAQPAASVNEDPRADTTGEEALRKDKIFTGGFRSDRNDLGEALFAAHSPFHHNQSSNTSDSSNNTQPQNIFGATNATQSNGGGFQFGSSVSQNQTGNSTSGGFNFAPTSQATSNNNSNNNSSSTFAFGSSTPAPVNNSTSPFNFGGTNSGQAEASFNFGANSLSKAQNPLTIENQKASNFNFAPPPPPSSSSSSSSPVLDGYNFPSSATPFSTNQSENLTYQQQLSQSDGGDTVNMFGNHRVEHPQNSGQAPAQPPQNPTFQSGFPMDIRYRGGPLQGRTDSIFGNSPLLKAARSNSTFMQVDSSTSFGQNNTNNSFGAQNNSFGGSFGGSFGNQANTSFGGFNSTNTAPPSSQGMFGNTTTATSAPPLSSGFTPSFPATTSAPSTTNMFGNGASSFPTTSAPTNTNMFGSANSSFPPATSSNTPIFGATQPAESTTSTSNAPLFGGLNKPADSTTATPSTSIFGGLNKPVDSTTATPSTSFFGAPKPTESTPSTPSASVFGGFKPADSTPSASNNPLFGGSRPAEPTPSTPSTPLFGASKPTESTVASSSTPLFGAPKPAESTVASSSTPNLFGKSSAAPASATPFTGFGQSAGSTSNIFNTNKQSNGQSNNIFGAKPAEEPKDKQTLDLFSTKPVGQQVSEPNATGNTMEKAPAQTPGTLFGGFGHVNSSANSSAEQQLGGVAKEQSFAAPTTDQAGSSFKIRGTAEASGFKNHPSPFKPADTSAEAAQPSPSKPLNSFSPQTKSSQSLNGGALSNGYGSDSMALSDSTTSSSQSPPPIDKTLAPGRLSDWEFQVAEPTNAEMDANMPSHFNSAQANEFKALWRIASVQRSMAAYFQHLPPGADPSRGLAWMEAKKKDILKEHKIDYISHKRGTAEADLENDENQENMSPRKKIRPDKDRSHRVSSPEKRSQRSTRSPEKRSHATNESESQLNGNSALKAPKLQPGRSSSPSKSPSRSTAPEPSSSKKRRSDTQLESGDGESGGHKKRKPEQPSQNGAAESGSSKKRKPEVYLTQDDPEGIEDGKSSNKRTVNGSSSTTSNMFKNILDSPDKSTRSVSPERKTRSMPGATKEAVSVPAEAPKANPFGNLAGATPIKPNTATTSTTPSKPPTFGSTPTSTTPTTSPSKPPTFTGAPTGGIKPPTFAGAPTGGVKPPTFGSGPVNFLAQFGQQATKYAEDNEKILMQKAKDADFDSEDDDEAEWEANYKKKRAAELKELNELAKSKAPNFLVKSAETAKSTEPKETAKPVSTNLFPPIATPPPTTTSSFGQPKPATGAAEGIFGSANPSRTSTPNVFSGTGSVLDGAASTSGKTPLFAGNPFAHLSDGDSNTQNDGDDESSEDGSDDEDDKKDPSYKPNTSNETLSTPSTPVDETGSSNASMKQAVTEPPKLNLFGSPASSGATTPTPGTGGSLLSRMSRDPVAEEKETSAPKSTSTNIFGSSFGATSGTTTDKTWKPDTPIKFGSAAPSAPTFNFTSSTPTKPAANTFGGLFGNSGTSTPALSSGPTTTTGFQFGGAPSATSSLFPSVAASADTSRATSPGATTDGATDADDNDPEKVHTQVNLLESNPGEENEDVIHSVRAKALKFSPKEEGDKTSSPWDTKGVGPLKVLRHRETKATRIILRSDPSGSIILNKSLLSQVKYEAVGKTIKLMTVGDDGKGLQTWLLQVKTTEWAEELAKHLEDNKANNN